MCNSLRSQKKSYYGVYSKKDGDTRAIEICVVQNNTDEIQKQKWKKIN